MARAHALSKRLVSSSSSVNDLVWPYPSWARIRVSEALGEAGNGGSPHLVGQSVLLPVGK
jgi:hypothetical protein